MDKAVGVDLGASKIVVALVDGKGSVHKSITAPTPKKRNKLVNRLKDCIRAVKGSQKINGIGVGAAGSSRNGKIIESPNCKALNGLGLAKLLRREFKCKVALMNDANAFAWGEYSKGAAKNCKNAVVLTIGSGVGSGVIVGGKLYEGKGLASEIGHMKISSHGKCNCKSKGCFECLVNGKAIMQRAKKAGLKSRNVEELAFLAGKGNSKAKNVFKETAYFLGIGLSNICNIFNPEVIVLGGGISNVGILISEAEKVMRKNAFDGLAQGVKVKKASLGNHAGAIGAALIALKK